MYKQVRVKHMYEAPTKRKGDIVPSLLEPGEAVLPVDLTKKLADILNTRVYLHPTDRLKDMKEKKIGKVMREFKQGELKSSSGDKVKDRKQAIAIALSESRKI